MGTSNKNRRRCQRVAEVVLRRQLTIADGGRLRKGAVTIYGPLRSKGAWECGVTITHLCPETVWLKAGDRLGAVQRALNFARGLIRGFIDDGAGIWHSDPGDFGGF